MDGTLLDTLQDLADSVNYVLKNFGLPGRTLAEIRSFVGNGVRRLLELSVPGGETHPCFEEIFKEFREYYSVHCNDKTRAYDGVLPLLRKLAQEGYALAIVSNKPDSAVKDLNEIYFEGIVKTAIGEMEGVAKKPAPDMVEKALDMLGKTKESAVYIGDSDVDLLTAEKAGLPCISVLWGFREEEFLKECGAQYFAKDPGEIPALIAKI